MKPEKTSTLPPRAGRAAGGSGGLVSLPAEALDDRIAIVGTAGSGKTYAAKGFVERLLKSSARVAIVDPRRRPGPTTLQGDPRTSTEDRSRYAQLKQELVAARTHIAILGEDNRELRSRLAEISSLAASAVRAPAVDSVVPASVAAKGPRSRTVKTDRPRRVVTSDTPATSGTSIHPAARKLLTALAQHAPARFTWGQAATLAGLKPSGGHFNSGRKDLRAAGYVAETHGLVTPTPDELRAAGEVPPAASTPADRLTLWCSRLPTPAPEMLRTLAGQGERYMEADELAAVSVRSRVAAIGTLALRCCATTVSSRPTAAVTGPLTCFEIKCLATRGHARGDLKQASDYCSVIQILTR
jgi:hypothetical protein